MKMFHYQVISLKDGKVASRFQIFARFVYFALISVALGYFTFGLSIICQIFSMFLTNKRQTFHGILSKTAVVCINAGDNVREEEFITIDLGEKLDDEIVNETSDINDEKDIIDVEVSEKDETKE